MAKRTDDERFWAKVAIGDGCWTWTAYVHPDKGYGQFKLAGRMVDAHKAAWLLERGSVPPGLDVCHSCDNRRCVRLSHLFLGTRQDNVDDMVSKGRQARGVRIHQARLTDEQITEVRALAEAGVRHRLIAQRFGVTRRNVSYIVRGHTWAHVAEAL